MFSGPKQVDFEQRQPLHIAIRNLIHDYPCDEGILKELIQNADDGGASEIRFILDLSDYGDLNGPVPGWKEFAKPALIAINDRPFSESDLDRITRLGDSGKVDSPTQTGRYGRGFNAVYNITDSPLLRTGNFVGFFDPCGWYSDSEKKGQGWEVDDTFHRNWPDALRMFPANGLHSSYGNHRYEASAFRFPLRSILKGQSSEDRLAEDLFTPKEFYVLVDGLKDLAEHLLLFLRNIRFVGCYEMHSPGGALKPLLEIKTTNSDLVEANRLVVNRILDGTSPAEVLDRIADANQGRVESTYFHKIEISDATGTSASSWLVSSGIYSGRDGRLVDLARQLNESHNRAIPAAGAAVCLERDGEPLAPTTGVVSCFLPLTGVLDAARLPFHINGAFDLDGSRSGLTRSRKGQAGTTRDRAEWNCVLAEDAVAESVVSMIVACRDLDGTVPGNLYQVFPDPREKLPDPFDSLHDAIYSRLAKIEVFWTASSKWGSSADLQLIPEVPDLQECLVLECFPIPDPNFPRWVHEGLQNVGCLPRSLSEDELSDHFRVERSGPWDLDAAPFEGIRQRRHLEALVRFLNIDLQFDEWQGLPLALCSDRRLHTFPGEGAVPLFTGTTRQMAIFGGYPEWFLEPDFVYACGFPRIISESLCPMDIDWFIDRLGEVIGGPQADKPNWNPTATTPPNAGWLVEVFHELNAVGADGRELPEKIKELPIIPGDDGCLHCPGGGLTPLLLDQRRTQLGPLLKQLGIRHWVLNPQSPLTKCLTVFRDQFDSLLRSLTPGDLIDSLEAKSEALLTNTEEWRKEEVVDRLLFFLGEGIKGKDLNERRIEIVRRLPIFQDLTGKYGSIEDESYIISGFEFPAISIRVRLLPGGRHQELLAALGVEKLGKKELLETCLLPRLSTMEVDSVVVAMAWIRDEWNNLIHSYPTERDLLLQLRGKPCLVSNDGFRRSPSDLYHPSVQDLIETLIGAEAYFPDPKLYGSDRKLWLTFFYQLTLSTSPRAQHLVDFIEEVIQRIKAQETTVAEQSTSLTKILRHFTDQWDHLALEWVESELYKDCQFYEFLAETQWIVPARIESKFYEPLVAENRLYAPKELLPTTQIPRAGSVRCFFPVPDFGPDLREKLRVDRIPPAAEICEHLQNVVNHLEGHPVSDDEMEELRRLVAGIYRGLGEHYRSAVESDDPEKMVELQKTCSALAALPCLFVTSESCFRCPRDVYQSGPQKLHPLKSFYRSDDPQVENGLNLLGRREEPSVVDLAATLVERASGNQPLDEEELPASVVTLKLIQQLIEDDEEPSESVEVRVPNTAGYLVDPWEVIYGDDLGLASQLSLDDHLVLFEGVPFETGIYKVARLSKATAKPVGTLTPSEDPAFLEQCHRIEKTIRSQEFAEGIIRIQQHEGLATYPNDLRWLERAEIAAFLSVTCRFVIELGSGAEVDLGRATVDVAFDEGMGDDGTFLVGESAIEVIYNRFADELAREIENAPNNKAPLVAILEREPDKIHHILDRLGIASLRDVSDVEDERFEPDLDILPEDEEFGESVEKTPGVAFEDDSETSVQSETETEGAEGDEDLDGDDPADRDQIDDREEIEQSAEDRDFEEENDDGQSPSSRRSGRSREPFNETRSGDKRSGDDTDRDRDAEDDFGDDDANEHETDQGERRGGGWKGPRGRMVRGLRQQGGNRNRAKKQPKRSAQDDLWISRPKTKRQTERSKQQNDEGDDEAPRNHSIGEAAVGWVLQYERQQGRRPMNMAHANPGYDIESRKGRIVDRYIEVKGIDGEWGKNGVPLSNLQFFRFQDPADPEDSGSPPIGERFWLYVVEHARDPENVKIHMIQSPADKATEFRFDCGWKEAGETAEDFRPLTPEVGMRLIDPEDEFTFREGQIIKVATGNYLTVKFESGPATTVVYDPSYHQLLPPEDE